MAEQAYLIFYNDNFEDVRTQLDEHFNIPAEGKIYEFKNEPAPTHQRGITYINPSKHPTENKYYIAKTEEITQFVINAADIELSQSQMESQGYFGEI